VKLLFDTHVFLWSITSRRLSDAADAAFLDPDNVLYLSAASFWEICIKLGIGKLTLPEDWRDTAELAMTINAIHWLPIEKAHCLELLTLPRTGLLSGQRDPFDRLLIAQARAEGLTVLTADPNFGRYDVPVVW
jgi:PIN domain nuclease of toxin-antitoxin system